MALIDDLKTYIRGSRIVSSTDEEERIDRIIDMLKVRLDRDGVVVDWNSNVVDAKSYIYFNFSGYMKNLYRMK